MTRLVQPALAAIALAASLFSPSSASAYERWIDIVNNAAAPIWSVQISHVDDNSFGRDLLGGFVINSGDTVRVEPDLNQGYCRFDILITFENGQETTLWGVNLCEAETLVANGRRAWVV